MIARATPVTRDTTVRKRELAKRLTKVVGNDFVVEYEPHCHNSAEHANRRNPSLGHLWSAQFYFDRDVDDDPAVIWLDDRFGDVAQQLAQALRAKAAMLLKMAEAAELEIRRGRKAGER